MLFWRQDIFQTSVTTDFTTQLHNFEVRGNYTAVCGCVLLNYYDPDFVEISNSNSSSTLMPEFCNTTFHLNCSSVDNANDIVSFLNEQTIQGYIGFQMYTTFVLCYLVLFIQIIEKIVIYLSPEKNEKTDI